MHINVKFTFSLKNIVIAAIARHAHALILSPSAEAEAKALSQSHSCHPGYRNIYIYIYIVFCLFVSCLVLFRLFSSLYISHMIIIE